MRCRVSPRWTLVVLAQECKRSLQLAQREHRGRINAMSMYGGGIVKRNPFPFLGTTLIAIGLLLSGCISQGEPKILKPSEIQKRGHGLSTGKGCQLWAWRCFDHSSESRGDI